MGGGRHRQLLEEQKTSEELRNRVQQLQLMQKAREKAHAALESQVSQLLDCCFIAAAASLLLLGDTRCCWAQLLQTALKLDQTEAIVSAAR